MFSKLPRREHCKTLARRKTKHVPRLSTSRKSTQSFRAPGAGCGCPRPRATHAPLPSEEGTPSLHVLLHASQGQDLALAVMHAPYSLDRLARETVSPDLQRLYRRLCSFKRSSHPLPNEEGTTKDFYLKAKDSIWRCLSDVCQIRSTAVGGVRSASKRGCVRIREEG